MKRGAPGDAEGSTRWAAVFLAAGYGTRLRRDLDAEAAAGYAALTDPHTCHSCLPVAGSPV